MKKWGILLLTLLMVMIIPQNSKANDEDKGGLQSPVPIPDQAMRLRIIANSDSEKDQWLKRKVRDNVNSFLTDKVKDLKNIDSARQIMKEQIPKLQEIVDNTLQEEKAPYKGVVDLGVVPFPTKKYGDYVYPAGNYEALRITLGAGLGQNWWCVLFPPLCFVDVGNNSAAIDQANTDLPQGAADTTVKDTAAENPTNEDIGQPDVPRFETKILVVEWFEKLFSAIRTLFA